MDDTELKRLVANQIDHLEIMKQAWLEYLRVPEHRVPEERIRLLELADQSGWPPEIVELIENVDGKELWNLKDSILEADANGGWDELLQESSSMPSP